MTSSIVPRHKQDFERANALASLPDQEVEPVIDDLIEWAIDSNWPIAVVVAKALFGRTMTLSAITTVLNGRDSTAKWHLINLIVHHMPRSSAVQLEPVFQRLAVAPSPDDRHEQVNLVAQEALDWLSGGADES